MNFDKAKGLVGVLVVLSCVICIFGLVTYEKGSPEMGYAALAAAVCIALSIGVTFKWCRCPWCGRVIFKGMFSVKVCPACRRDLATGKKKKGKGGKK